MALQTRVVFINSFSASNIAVKVSNNLCCYSFHLKNMGASFAMLPYKGQNSLPYCLPNNIIIYAMPLMGGRGGGCFSAHGGPLFIVFHCLNNDIC